MKKESIVIIGLGYVGLPLLIELSKKFEVKGFDTNKEKISQLKRGVDNNLIINKKDLKKLTKIFLTSDLKDIKSSNVYIVCVPTPVLKNKLPDLSLLKSASKIVGKVISNKDLVILESTVFPGATEEVCIPIIEKYSNLKCDSSIKKNKNYFTCAYSPERVNPGDPTHQLRKIKKVVSASSKNGLQRTNKIYKKIINAGTHIASSIKVAEAAKIIENTQRDVNVALVNELSKIFNILKVDTNEVLKAAGTKWNFAKYVPGLVGGHCIGVDPYYLTYKSKKSGYFPKMILAGRKINDGMSKHVSNEFLKLMKIKKINIKKSKILIFGLTFKENVADTRNSKVFDLIRYLKKNVAQVCVYDPLVKQKKFPISFKLKNFLDYEVRYDGLILAVPHKKFLNLSKRQILKICKPNSVIFDLKDVFPNSLVDKRL